MPNATNPNSMRTKLKGLTLIEIVVAMGVFTILMLAVSDIFASAFRAQRETTRLQQNLEAAQAAMNLMAKELRTSSIVFPDGETENHPLDVQFIDYSQGKCIRYKVDAGVLKKWAAPQMDADPDAKRSNCRGRAIESSVYAVGELARDITTSWYKIQTSTNSAPRRVGRVTVWLKIGTAGYNRTIQSSVSLRDFNYIGI